MGTTTLLACTALASACMARTTLAREAALEAELGRSETRVWSAPFPLVTGRTIAELALSERLERLGYERVKSRPDVAGEYFWGEEVFWLFRHAHRSGGKDFDARLLGLGLRARDGLVFALLDEKREEIAPSDADDFHVEPELLAESLAADRARRRLVLLEQLPEHAWRALLAAEDARFFDHVGIDPRGIARAVVANVKARGVEQGGSTITQQLVKMRDMTPKRTLGRKASEALRALTLESEHDKKEILEAYLNHVYYGHVEGVAVHGIGAASRAYFGKSARELDLAESALLAAIIQGPNRLAPDRHSQAARERRDWVLGRMQEQGWATAEQARRAKASSLGVEVHPQHAMGPSTFLSWVGEVVRSNAPNRMSEGRGVVVETSLDPQLQRWAEDAVRDHLAELRREHRNLRNAPLSAALVALDAETGAVLAEVGGDPDDPPRGLDRVRSAKRQPGSTIKPLLLLSAFESCGNHGALTAASRLLDEPLTVSVPDGTWSPSNNDGQWHGVVELREALDDSLNVPFVRMALHCGCQEIADRLRGAGLELPELPPPSFALGAIEATPLQMAKAFTAFATPGYVMRPRPVWRIERPQGSGLENLGADQRRVVSPASAYLVMDMLRTVVSEGTATGVALPGLDVAAKTGTSSERRDAWLAGLADSVVCVAWVGLDDGKPLGLTGARAAAPLWRDFMNRAARARPPREVPRPSDVVELYVDTRTGLLVRETNAHARRELFRKGAMPRRDRWFRWDDDMPVVR